MRYDDPTMDSIEDTFGAMASVFSCAEFRLLNAFGILDKCDNVWRSSVRSGFLRKARSEKYNGEWIQLYRRSLSN